MYLHASLKQIILTLLLTAGLFMSLPPGAALADTPAVQPDPPLFPYSADGELYGYVDTSGAFVIEPQFEFADAFSEGLAVVNLDQRYGFIDQSGQFVIEPQFEFATPFKEGLAAVSINDKTGFIDAEGAVVITPRFDFANNFAEGLAMVGLNRQVGYIDLEGDIVIEPQFEYGSNFAQGLAAVEIDGQFGYIDAEGNLVIEPQFDFANDFSEGLAAVSRNGQMGYVDSVGDLVIPTTLIVGGPFAEGLAYAESDDRRGYIDPDGEFMIEGQFDFGDPFAEGLAAVSIGGQYGYIDAEGNIIIEPQFTFAGPFENGLATVIRQNIWGAIDTAGTVLFELPIPIYGGLMTTITPYLPAVPEQSRSGACFGPSLVSAAASAYRCTIDDAGPDEANLFDPCLIADDGETLVCGMEPLAGEAGFQLTLTEPLPTPEPTAVSTPAGQRLSAEALANATYPNELWGDGSVITLTDGGYEMSETETAPDVAGQLLAQLVTKNIAYGDLNGDDLPDAAVVLVINGSGSGSFYYLYAVLNEDGRPAPTTGLMLGDRIMLEQVTIEDGHIVIDMITQGPEDGLCCPTVPLTVAYRLSENGTFTQVGENVWLVQLLDGATCTLTTGATAVINEQRVNYVCTNNAFLLGDLLPGVVWTAEQITLDPDASEPTISTTATVDVARVIRPADPARLTAEIGLSPADVSLNPGPLAQSVAAHIRPAMAYNPNVPPALNGTPAHLRLAFDGQQLPGWPDLINDQPQLMIYPIDAYLAMYNLHNLPGPAQEITPLKLLLAERPETITLTDTLPALPGVRGNQTLLAARPEYIEFEGGAGLRYLTYYVQDVSPVTNESLLVTFQGITDDGEYYVSYFSPISSTVLPDTFADSAAADDYEAFAVDYQGYLVNARQVLEAAPPTDFSPALTDIDAMLESLTIGDRE